MNTGMIPVRYAKALLEFAYEKKCAEQVYAEMSAVAGSFEREHALRRVLDNPVLPVDKKTELIPRAEDERAKYSTGSCGSCCTTAGNVTCNRSA